MVALPGSEYREHQSSGPQSPEESYVEDAFARLGEAAPEGWRVELIDSEIHVTPPSNGAHAEYVSAVTEQVRDHSKTYGRYTGIGLNLPGPSGTDHVIPDLVIAPKGSFADQEEWHAPDAALMIVEVTSKATAGNDRVKKLRGYARAGVPVYLLIDRDADQVVVCWDPEGEDYTRKSSYRLGKVVPLPEPLGFELDTAEF